MMMIMIMMTRKIGALRAYWIALRRQIVRGVSGRRKVYAAGWMNDAAYESSAYLYTSTYTNTNTRSPKPV